MIELRKSADRGTGKQPWLDARFTFSFGPYQDPAQNGFSDLRLMNYDRAAHGERQRVIDRGGVAEVPVFDLRSPS